MANDTKKGAAKGTDGLEQPLFTLSYELSNQLVEDTATALAGERMRNPGGILSAVVLVVIILVAASPLANSLTPLLIVLVVAEVGLWQVAEKWQRIQVRRVRRAGLDTALFPADERRREVVVYADRVVVEPESGEASTHLLSDLRKPRAGAEMLVLRFSDGSIVPIPRRSMSAGRFNDLTRLVSQDKKAGK